MGAFRYRTDFVAEVNRAFGEAEIEGTAERLRPLSQGADALDMMHALGLLRWVPQGRFDRYRQRLRIPRLVMRILTEAFRTALDHGPRPMPVRFSIVQGPAEAVAVTVHGDRIEIVLTRTEDDPPME